MMAMHGTSLRYSVAGLALGAMACLSPVLSQETGERDVGNWRLLDDPDFFPLAVWLQAPKNAPRFQAAGINLYVGLWQGPTAEQLAELRDHEMPVICAQNAFGISHLDEPLIVGWMHGDEPDNAQDIRRGWPELKEKDVQITVDGLRYGHYGPPIPPGEIIHDYRVIKAVDPTRPVFLNLGQGVVWPYPGRGVRKNHPEDYPKYARGCDILSFDVYPARHRDEQIKGKLYKVAEGVNNLEAWTTPAQRVWNCIECNRSGFMDEGPTPEQVVAEVWMSIIHGSQGIIYFVHHFGPFVEAGLLRDEAMLETVTELNRRITQLAPVIKSRRDPPDVAVSSASPDVPVDVLVRVHNDDLYLFAACMRDKDTTATFTLPRGFSSSEAEVLFENRTLTPENGRLQDRFEPYGIHIYQLRPQ